MSAMSAKGVRTRQELQMENLPPYHTPPPPHLSYTPLGSQKIAVRDRTRGYHKRGGGFAGSAFMPAKCCSVIASYLYPATHLDLSFVFPPSQAAPSCWGLAVSGAYQRLLRAPKPQGLDIRPGQEARREAEGLGARSQGRLRAQGGGRRPVLGQPDGEEGQNRKAEGARAQEQAAWRGCQAHGGGYQGHHQQTGNGVPRKVRQVDVGGAVAAAFGCQLFGFYAAMRKDYLTPNCGSRTTKHPQSVWDRGYTEIIHGVYLVCAWKMFWVCVVVCMWVVHWLCGDRGVWAMSELCIGCAPFGRIGNEH